MGRVNYSCLELVLFVCSGSRPICQLPSLPNARGLLHHVKLYEAKGEKHLIYRHNVCKKIDYEKLKAKHNSFQLNLTDLLSYRHNILWT